MKLRDLRVAKRYRDAVKKWGEPDALRKRTIIAPSMSDVLAKDVNIRPAKEEDNERSSRRSEEMEKRIEWLFKDLNIETVMGHDDAGLCMEHADYQIWLEKEKKLRKDLNGIGLNEHWLLRKNDLTALERRVFARLRLEEQEEFDTDDQPQEVKSDGALTPPPLSKAQLRLLPLLQQPIPVAMSIIAEYCHENKLRLLDLYTQMDRDKDWLVSRDEVRKIVRSNNIPLTDAQLEAMIIALDADNNDQLDYSEFAHGVEAYKIDKRWQQIREIMRIMEAHQEKVEDKNMEISPTPKEDRRRITTSARHSPRLKYDEDSRTKSESSIEHFLKLPNVDATDQSDSLATKQGGARRMRKHKERKEKKKQRGKQMKTKVFQHSTIGGETGQMKDRIAEKTVIEVKTSLDMMHTSGIPVKEEAVKNVMLFPWDKPVEDCKSSLRTPVSGLVSNTKFGLSFSNLCNGDGGVVAEKNHLHQQAIQSRNRKSRRIGRKKRMPSIFWPDTTYSHVSVDQLGRNTPQESVFNIITA